MKYKVVRIWYVDADNSSDAISEALDGRHHDLMVVRLDIFPDGVIPSNL